MSDPLPPIDGAMKQRMDAFAVPELPAGFADRIVTVAENRAPLLPAKRPIMSRIRGWSSARKAVVGVAATGMLATAAAATGMLERVGVELPSVEQVVEAIAGGPDPLDAALENELSMAPSDELGDESEGAGPTQIDGSIDTPEELDEAYRQLTERRSARRDQRRARIDEALERRLERRRAQGLPAPTAEEEAQLRERIEQRRATRDARDGARMDQRRDSIQQRMEAGDGKSLREIVEEERAARRANREANGAVGGRKRWRDMTQEERRARRQEIRERRAKRLGNGAEEVTTQPNVQPSAGPIAAPVVQDIVGESVIQPPAPTSAPKPPETAIPADDE